MQFYTWFVSLFTVSEVLLLVLKKSKTSSVKRRSDGSSLLWLWIIISVCIITGYTAARLHIWLPGDPFLFNVSGVSITVIGFIIRWFAIVQLGNMFTVDVAISSAHVLKTDGIYKIVRHPSYLGLLLIIIGLALLMDNILSCVIIILPVFFIINYRITVEEQALMDEFGDQYRQYKSRVRKIIPLIY